MFRQGLYWYNKFINTLGSESDPYDSLVKAMKTELIKAQSYFFADIIFNLENGDHYVLPSDFDDIQMIHFFRR